MIINVPVIVTVPLLQSNNPTPNPCAIIEQLLPDQSTNYDYNTSHILLEHDTIKDYNPCTNQTVSTQTITSLTLFDFGLAIGLAVALLVAVIILVIKSND